MPTDNPSGTLWIVTAKNILLVFPNLFVLIPSSPPSRWKCGTNLSMPQMKKAPNRIDIDTIAHIGRCFVSLFKAGTIKENMDAASIMPEAKPRNIWLIFGDISFFLKKKTKAEAVAALQR